MQEKQKITDGQTGALWALKQGFAAGIATFEQGIWPQTLLKATLFIGTWGILTWFSKWVKYDW